MNSSPRLGLGILGVAIALGIFGDALLRATPWGVNVLLWTAALALLLFVLSRWQDVRLTGGGRWLIAPALFFAAAFAWHDSPTLNFLNLTALLTTLALTTASARAGRIRVAGVMDYARAQLLAAGHAMFGGFSLLATDVQWRAIPRNGWSRQALAVGRGLLIGLPLVLVFGGLFVAADAAFEDLALDLFNWDFNAIFTHAFFIGVWA